MMPLDPAAHAILYGALAATAFAGGWLACAGLRRGAPKTASAAAAAIALRGRARPDAHGREAGEIVPHRGLRAPIACDSFGPESPDPALSQAAAALLSALDDCRSPHPRVAEALRAARLGSPTEPLCAPPFLFEHGALDRIQFEHAWMETLLVELMMRCREAGSWVAASHLDPFLRDRPDIAAALRAGRDGAVAPEGAGIVAHWKAERAAGQALLVPRVAAAEAALAEAGR